MNLGTSDGALHNLYMKGEHKDTGHKERQYTWLCLNIFISQHKEICIQLFIYATIKQVWTRHNEAHFLAVMC